jgi:hypothetical protein
MKKFKNIFIVLVLFVNAYKCNSQTINWKNIDRKDKHIGSIHTGLEYGLVFGVVYSYKLKTKRPIFLNIECSIPSGENLIDDFKTKLGGQIALYKIKNFHFIAKAQGIFRRTENDFIRLQNFGAEISATGGYYKHRWFAASEIGFDKAIVTHFKHSAAYKQIYPFVNDGWYEPSTGGNFNLHLLVGYSFKHSDIFAKAGIITTQSLSKPLLPIFTELGYTIKFKSEAKN